MEKENQKINVQKNKSKKLKLKPVSICAFVVGIIMLIVGVVFLILKMNSGPKVADGEYLVSAENWTLDGSDGVIWDFTEIGKGKLTTNNHVNDYDFTWALKDGELLIETDWLYDLENKYDYKLDQNNGTLLLNSGDKEYKFVANFTDKK